MWDVAEFCTRLYMYTHLSHLLVVWGLRLVDKMHQWQCHNYSSYCGSSWCIRPYPMWFPMNFSLANNLYPHRCRSQQLKLRDPNERVSILQIKIVSLPTELPGTAARFFYHWGMQLKSQHLWQYWAKRGASRCPDCNADSSIGSRGCKQIVLQGRVWGRYWTLITNTNNYKTLW